MPTTQQPTKPGIRKLSEFGYVVAPTGIVSTGWPAVRKTCNEKLGVRFDDWQEGAGRLILAKRADGTLAAMIDGVGLSLPRQVGKTYLVGASIFALCVNTPNMLVIWSAHHARTHGETFLAMQAFANRSRVKAYVRQVFTGSGDEEIRFHNGSRILFGARERGFGRGIAGVDVLIFDEAQILSDKALSNMLATLNTSRFGLALYIGTPPKPDDMSESFTRMRDDAHAGRLSDGAWIEFGADKGADPKDRKQWARANPSYPKRTPSQSILRLQRKLTPADFLREGLGLWDEDVESTVVDLRAWRRMADPASTILDPVVFALETAPDRSMSAIAAAGFRADGLPHAEIVRYGRGTGWAAAELERLSQGHVVADARSPAAAIATALPDEPMLMSAVEMARACGAWLGLVESGGMRHLGDPVLEKAIKAASTRRVGSAQALDPFSGEITPLTAVVLALYGLTTIEPEEEEVEPWAVYL